MCGIAGLISVDRDVDVRAIRAASDALHHRGPDGKGFLLLGRDGVVSSTHGTADEIPVAHSPRVALVHRRLAIIDLSSAAAQPMSSSDGRLHLVFNGEIYNYLELRARLERLGWVFRSHSDTEVLLAGFAIWGPDVLPKLVGMFAFAMLDRVKRKLFLARDFFGIKPLYFTHSDGYFAFASEIRPLLLLSNTHRTANPQRVYDYLRWGLTDHGTGTLFQSVQQLAAGHYAEVDIDKPRVTPARYWAPTGSRVDMSFAEATSRLRDLWTRSIELHLRSDVPVGSALSGGLDSSAVVAGVRRVGGQAVALHAVTYTAGEGAVNEEPWADLVAERTDATLHKTGATSGGLVADLPRLIATQGEPVAGTSVYAQYRVFSTARDNGLKVMLDGQGSDEMFGGYDYHQAGRLASLAAGGSFSHAWHLLRALSAMPRTNEARRVGMARPLLESLALIMPQSLQTAARRATGDPLAPEWLNPRWLKSNGVVCRSPFFSFGKGFSFRTLLVDALLRTSLPMLLRYEDRNSMAFSVESRVPFLTPQLVDFALSLPDDYLVGDDGRTKQVLREALRGIVPDEIIDRRDKIGFSSPQARWIGDLAPNIERAIRSDTCASIPAFQARALIPAWEAMATSRQFRVAAWRWFNFIEWVREFDVRFQ